MSATPEQIADLCERLRSHAASAPVISRQSIDMDAAAAVISAQVKEIARLEAAAGEVWEEAYAEGAGDTAGWEKETAHAVLKWLDKEGDGFDIHHPDGNTTDAIIQGLYDAKRIGNMAELRAQAERVRVLEGALEAIKSDAAHVIDFYNRNGPTWTGKDGHEYDDMSSVLGRAETVIQQIDAALRGEA